MYTVLTCIQVNTIIHVNETLSGLNSPIKTRTYPLNVVEWVKVGVVWVVIAVSCGVGERGVKYIGGYGPRIRCPPYPVWLHVWDTGATTSHDTP